jgi:hypothetical protein
MQMKNDVVQKLLIATNSIREEMVMLKELESQIAEVQVSFEALNHISIFNSRSDLMYDTETANWGIG